METVKLIILGTNEYNLLLAWILKRQEDGLLASDFVFFIGNQHITIQGRERVIAAGHAISSIESYLGLQDTLRKLQSAGGTCQLGTWAGVSVFNKENVGVVILTSQEKWDRLKSVCWHWFDIVRSGETLDYKKSLSDRGFLMYIAQAYPGMKPYLKGFHLSLVTWQGNQDSKGWKIKSIPVACEHEEVEVVYSMKEIKLQALYQGAQGTSADHKRLPSDTTMAVPRFIQDLAALLLLTNSDHPTVCRVRSNLVMTAYYSFGNASSGGFSLTVEYPDGLHGRFGLWGRDAENDSLNYRELHNLVKMVEEEAANGVTNNSTAESSFFKGGSKSFLLHELVLRLWKVDLDKGFLLHLVHIASTQMIAQGTDGLLHGIYLEGVMSGNRMLSYINFAKST